MITKKNYELAAEIVRNYRSPGTKFGLADVVESSFVKLFYEDNPNFDEEKFRKLCKNKPIIEISNIKRKYV